MSYDFANEGGIYAPIEQARRCLDTWLREEKRALPAPDRERAAALMARYFLNEDDVPDQLMLSFLRHYSGKREIDIEDPTSVRMEIKALLDKAAVDTAPPLFAPYPSRHKKMLPGIACGIVLTALFFSAWQLSQKKITLAQQDALKTLVHQVSLKNGDIPEATIWAALKKDLGVRRYQDIPYWDYNGAINRLQGWKPG